jgi:hypothetical protein
LRHPRGGNRFDGVFVTFKLVKIVSTAFLRRFFGGNRFDAYRVKFFQRTAFRRNICAILAAEIISTKYLLRPESGERFDEKIRRYCLRLAGIP